MDQALPGQNLPILRTDGCSHQSHRPSLTPTEQQLHLQWRDQVKLAKPPPGPPGPTLSLQLLRIFLGPGHHLGAVLLMTVQVAAELEADQLITNHIPPAHTHKETSLTFQGLITKTKGYL